MFRSTSNFDKLLEKSTSHLLLEPDWNVTLQLCDCIRQGDVQPKYALAALKKKLYATNPHVVLYALQVLESLVKNCGAPIQIEVASKPFMDELKELLRASTNENVKNKIKELIQAWAFAFRNEPNYRAVQDALNIMKLEGFNFPVLNESDAMFLADRAPEWADGDCCHRCRVQFTMVQRKHHCRNCGQVFCGKCSSRLSTIPQFGIEKEVRVCDSCYDKLNKHPASASPKANEGDLPAEYVASSLAQQPQVPSSKSEQELQEEEDLQLAIALSKSEAESKEKEKLRATSTILSNAHNAHNAHSHNSSVHTTVSAPSLESNMDMDPDLAHYLNRPYWEHRQQMESARSSIGNASTIVTTSSAVTVTPSAPAVGHSMVSHQNRIHEAGYENGELDELDEFLSTLRGSLEIFVNRMRSNSSRGRSIAVDSAVQSLFLNITAMHSQLLKHIQDEDDQRVYYEGLQDKLTQARDARAALDALREEHRDRIRREAEEAERQRQIQMAQKLEIMRKKKQEYLQYQRQIAMQRLQEQEREMQMRQEQQKQQYMRQLGPQQPQGYVPNPVNDSPVHGGYHPGYHYPATSGQGAQITPEELQAYNMQSIAGAVPQMPPVSQIPPGGYHSHPYTSQSQSLGPPSMGVNVPSGPPGMNGPQHVPGPGVLGPHQPTIPRTSLEAELISFD